MANKIPDFMAIKGVIFYDSRNSVFISYSSSICYPTSPHLKHSLAEGILAA